MCSPMPYAERQPPICIELDDTEQELQRQDERWGEQNHPDIGPTSDPGGYTPLAEAWKHINAARVTAGSLAWDGILLEEVFEAFEQAELGNEDEFRTELIQVAAVALQWAGAIRRRQKNR